MGEDNVTLLCQLVVTDVLKEENEEVRAALAETQRFATKHFFKVYSILTEDNSTR